MRLCVPATHVQSHFADHRLRYQHADAINPRQIHSADAIELAAEIKAGRVALGSFTTPGQFDRYLLSSYNTGSASAGFWWTSRQCIRAGAPTGR